MKISILLLKLGAVLSLLSFFLISMAAVPSVLREPVVLKVHQKYLADGSYVIEGITDSEGKINATYSKKFFDKAQLGDTIRFKVAYRLLVKDGQIASIDIGKGIRFFPIAIVSSLFPVLIFFPNNRILRRRLGYWLIGTIELFNLLLLGVFFLPL
jgi:hypothetical protein